MGSVAIARNDSGQPPGSATADRCLTALHPMLHFSPGKSREVSTLGLSESRRNTVTGGFPSTADRPEGNWCHSRQRWLQGHPDDAQRWQGKRAQRTQ